MQKKKPPRMAIYLLMLPEANAVEERFVRSRGSLKLRQAAWSKNSYAALGSENPPWNCLASGTACRAWHITRWSASLGPLGSKGT